LKPDGGGDASGDLRAAGRGRVGRLTLRAPGFLKGRIVRPTRERVYPPF